MMKAKKQQKKLNKFVLYFVWDSEVELHKWWKSLLSSPPIASIKPIETQR